jgi:hypothetical protein
MDENVSIILYITKNIFDCWSVIDKIIINQNINKIDFQ